MKYHMIGFAAGFVLDLLLGDPHGMPHPIRLIGNLIAKLDQKLMKEHSTMRAERQKGVLLVLLVLLACGILSFGILIGSYLIHPVLGCAIEAVMTYYILAAKSLKDESMKVYDALLTGDLEASRYAVSMIVGRDTAVLDETGVAKAAVETVAENTSDGVIAPMLYTALGGPILGFLYKGINTMDSMVGYKNERYMHFGTAAAKLDDAVNFIPSRISAVFIILSAYLTGLFRGRQEYDGARAFRIFRRDRFNHKSPNSAQTESACAGALGIQLAGDACYFGKLVKKPTMGDDVRPVEFEDIRRINRLMYVSAFLGEILCLAVMAGIGTLM